MLMMLSLDSEDSSWLVEQMGNGNLPNLAALARQGEKVDVDAAVLAGIAYPGLYTGQLPPHHGLYFPAQWQAPEQRVVDWSLFPYPETVLEIAARSGKRVVALDPPECHPMNLPGGFAISGLQFRARVLLHPWATDEARAARLVREMGLAPRADEVFGRPETGALRKLRAALVDAPARLTRAALAVLKEDQPDLLWLTCCGMHIAGHQFYRLPWISDPEMRRVLEQTRLDVARGYDRMLGEIAPVLPPGTRIIAAYSKGMGPMNQWPDLLPQMVDRVLGQTGGGQPLDRIRTLIPVSIRRWIADRVSDERSLEIAARLSTPRVDWSKTRAFCLPTDSPGFIRLNVRGRERLGIVDDREVLELSGQLIEGLCGFTDASGTPLISRVETPVELLGSGPRTGQFPDLIVTWHRRESPARMARSPRFGEVIGREAPPGRAGSHCPGAFAILTGGEIRQDAARHPMQVVDIPATILHGLGVNGPGLPGRSYWN